MPHLTDILSRAADALVRIVSPRRAILRQHMRRMEREPEYRETWLAALRAYGYKAAKSGSGITPWGNSAGSADAEISSDLPALRSRAREVNRDDPIGRGLTKTLVLNTIGVGLRPRARTPDRALNTKLETIWRRRKDRLYLAEGLTHEAGQRLQWRKRIEDGESLKRAVKRTPDEPIWFELIEADRLMTPAWAATEAGKEIRDGVVRDADGIVTGYWVLRGHPGDAFGIASMSRDAFRFVPAEFFRHSREVERPGQTRGVPAFCSILQDLRDLDLLIEASLKRMQVAACLSAFIKSEQPLENLLDVTARRYGYELNQIIQPGMIFRLYPNEEIQTLSPNFPTPELGPFIVNLARRIGTAVGVSWQIVLRDFSQSTYSSARSDQLDSRLTFYVGRQEAASDLTWEWRLVMADARLLGEPELQGVTDDLLEMVDWIGPKWEWVDPEKDANAAVTQLRNGLNTYKSLWLEQGLDPDEMETQLAAEKPLREEFALSVAKAAPPADTDTEYNEPPPGAEE